MNPTKYVFFGTPYVARDTLAVLLEHGFKPEVVVTNPDAPRGRGHELLPCETKEFALAHSIPVLTPEKIDAETISMISSYGAEYALCVAYGKIMPEELIASFPKGILNVHYSLLPKYRGASPVETALLNGEPVTGVTIQKMVLALDAGDILAAKELAIEPNETTRELKPRLIALGSQLLVETLPHYLAGEITPTPQDASLATRARKIEKEQGELFLDGDDTLNWNKYRAYAESPGTYFFAEKNGTKRRVKIKKAEFAQGKFRVLRVVPEGKSEMNYEDFTRSL